MNKPDAPATHRNREPILEELRRLIAGDAAVLEVGSGTGQHAVFFAGSLPAVTWYATDREDNHAGIRAWVEAASLPNLLGPLQLDVTQMSWPAVNVDAIFTANTLHIMDWQAVEAFFDGAGRCLSAGGLLIVYGPFHYGGAATSESNARFDESLRSQPGGMGVRDFEAVAERAELAGFTLLEDITMPANNRLLVWSKDDG